jgi:cytochrome bd ubiquinol oxidase subunit II
MDESAKWWMDLAALAALAGIVAYALFGGADFGGGVWDLFAYGDRKKEQRLAIQRAIGPVWEANHVWLIFVLVILFTCFPRGYAALGMALFLPFHLALLGIVLRGASFIFRSYQRPEKGVAAETSGWGIVFGVASTITPVLLGTAFGVVTQGRVGISPEGEALALHPVTWLSRYAVTNGLLALSSCAYLAAVYLTNETQGALREDFRQRAMIAGTTTAVLAGLVLLFAWCEASWFFGRLLSERTAPLVSAGLFCFAASGWSVLVRRYRLSRLFASGEITLLLLGWGVAQYPYLAYPDMRLDKFAAPAATLRFVVLSLPIGALLLIPSLWALFKVFKSQPQQNPSA